MHVADLNRKRKRKKIAKKSANLQRSANKDPLQSFNDGGINLDGLDGDDVEDQNDDDDGEEDMPDFGPSDAKRPRKDNDNTAAAVEKKIFTNTRDGTGKSTSGRNAWKEKHRKGKFSGKKRMSERRKKAPLGI